MRILIVGNTYYQVLFAMQLKNTLFANDNVVLLISDHSVNAECVAKQLNSVGFFESVHFVSTPGSGDKRNNLEKIRDFFQISFCRKNRYDFYTQNIDDLWFDEILVFNYNIQTYGIFSKLSSINKKIKVSRFEEGILSYSTESLITGRRKLIGFFRKLQKKPIIETALSNYYCFYPDLYNGLLNPVAVPRIEPNEEFSKILQQAFSIDTANISYPEKYIFFTSVYDFEGGEPIGEFEVVSEIANIVGKDNLLVKMHPRDRRSIYENAGFKVDKNSSIPWEAIQLSFNFDGKIFLTATSGSVLAGSLMSEKPVATYYMYKCCNIKNNPAAIKTSKDIERLYSDENLRKILREVHIASKIDDVLQQ